MSAELRSAQPFFLDAQPGKRFCMYHQPPNGIACRGAILYAPPFGDEMNMSRRMAAMQSRAFARAGYAVLQIDLYGCGDSDGELVDATWEIWQRDLAVAVDWMRMHASPLISLWGLRLGATLGIDYIRKSGVMFERCILWQPVINGRTYMAQFIRLLLAEGLMSEAKKNSGLQKLHTNLTNRGTVEVGGYELPPALMAGIEATSLSRLDTMPCPVYWLDLIPEGKATPSTARMNTMREWINRQIDVRLQFVSGSPFWATNAISDCPELISATLAQFTEMAT